MLLVTQVYAYRTIKNWNIVRNRHVIYKALNLPLAWRSYLIGDLGDIPNTGLMSKWLTHKLYRLGFVTKIIVVDGYQSLEATCSLCFWVGGRVQLKCDGTRLRTGGEVANGVGSQRCVVESSWNVMAQGDTKEEKWRGNWRMEWVASVVL
jgi:hypothetical protein